MIRVAVKASQLPRMLAFSLLLHVTLFVVIGRFGYFMLSHEPATQAYYVDVVNLPVANPQSGNPSPSIENAPAKQAPVQQEMSRPASDTASTVSPKAAPSAKKEQMPAETNEEFTKRLAALEKKAEGRRLGEALDDLRRRSAEAGRAGMPGAKGKEAGSDYGSYIQSRLRDAFNSTIAYQSRNPEVVIKLRINRFGKVIGYRMERSSRDKLFEAAVARAIDIAEEHFPPPPAGGDFEQGFIFRPEGVGKK